MSGSGYTPTTEMVREGFADDPMAEYYDPITNHAAYNRRAFNRWLVAHDAEVRADQIRKDAAIAETLNLDIKHCCNDCSVYSERWNISGAIRDQMGENK